MKKFEARQVVVIVTKIAAKRFAAKANIKFSIATPITFRRAT
ncbi:hypothetical protein HMPREF0201_04553 [Cedecea davisae DSM 4568]|uniref:Uncharacterized protein n=1 Tax=Cedecea davisae DSM 4568 TaxID=566551 RepID=S3IIQ2_9ENTR|nr:hypothetical protein HMPREF0201_04553 [Cedecea davisae DSM 4568]